MGINVRVYCDTGVGPFSYRETVSSLRSSLGKAAVVDSINASQIKEGSWIKETALLAFPGGRDVPYDAALRGVGNALIRRFVENGGSYLGICAGAYYGAASIRFLPGSDLEVVASRELGFFPGVAWGPVHAADKFAYDSEAGAVAAPVEIAGQKLSAYFNGGCAFTPVQDERVSVIGSYTNGEPAVVSCKVGKGFAVLSGLHLEYRLSSIKSAAISQGLAASEEVRQSIFRDLSTYLVARASSS